MNPASPIALDTDDPRLDGRSCFLCGKKIRHPANLCFVESPQGASPLSSGVRVSAHTYCANGMSSDMLAALHKRAQWGALTGKKELIS